jgi:eight-cysteine-cluster-containing protein
VANSAKAPEGVYARVRDNGVRCITWPCPSISEGKLNSWLWGNIAGVDLSWSEASEDELSKAYEAMTTTDGLLITGWRYWFKGPGGWGAGRTAEQFFRRVTPAPQKTCHVGGCSGQVCSDRDDVVTTCEWRDEYACYDTATCELQGDGNCGWTETPELTACLENPPTP